MNPPVRSSRQDLLNLLLLFLASRFVLTCIGVGSRILLEPFHPKRARWIYSPHLPLDLWGVWDTGIYLNLAQYGYSDPLAPPPMPNYPFFPLYPLLLRLLSPVTGGPFPAGLLVSNACFLGAAFLLHRIILRPHGESVAWNAVLFLFLSPTAFVFSGVFTESLFLLLLLACFHCLSLQRWGWLVPCGFLLGLSRLAGMFGFAALLLEVRNLPAPRWKAILALLAIPAGLLAFMGFLYLHTGDPLAFMSAQQQYGRSFNDPVSVMLEGFRSSRFDLQFSAGFTLAGFGLLLAASRTVPASYLVFWFLSLVVPLTSGSVVSMPRYLLVVFPLPVYLALKVQHPVAREILLIGLALLQGALMIFWCNGFNLII